MYDCTQCGKPHDNPDSVLCASCKDMHSQLNWGELLKNFVKLKQSNENKRPTQSPPSTPKKEEVKNTNPTTAKTVDEILTKSGYRGYDSLSNEELNILHAYRDKMIANRQ